MGDQIDDILVVMVIDNRPFDSLLLVHVLLNLEDVTYEKCMKSLVGEIDA